MSLRRRINIRKHEIAAENGAVCPNDIRECPSCIETALDAGIPLDVIQGKRKLTEAVSPEQYREDMIAGGRGHLLRDNER